MTKRTYTHSSQVSIDDTMPGTLTPPEAQRLAEVLGLEAFQDSADYQWYGFTEGSSDITPLNNSLRLRILQYAGVDG